MHVAFVRVGVLIVITQLYTFASTSKDASRQRRSDDPESDAASELGMEKALCSSARLPSEPPASWPPPPP